MRVTPSPSRRIVHGVGVDGLEAADGPLDCGNAGTGMRLLAGLLAAQPFDSVLVGEDDADGKGEEHRDEGDEVVAEINHWSVLG